MRNETIRSDRECMSVCFALRCFHALLQLTNPSTTGRYNDAMATIRRVPALDHNFQLVITRVYEEGDQELLEDEDESKHDSRTVFTDFAIRSLIPLFSRRGASVSHQ